MKTARNIGLAAVALAALASPAYAAGTSDLSILKSYAADFEKDPSLTKPVVFGVRVGEVFYTVDARPAGDGAPARVSVAKGAPRTPTFFFTVESGDYLAKVAGGDFNALTSMAKAFSTDYAPMDIDAMDGYQPADDFGDWVVPFAFHFWTKGLPEIVPFAPEKTRFTHGANAGVFYYQPGLRSGWFDIRPGQHVNENENSRTNPFPSMFIMTGGEVTAIIGGERRLFKAGEMMFVPPDVSHEFLNEGDKPAQGFLFMFGDGA